MAYLDDEEEQDATVLAGAAAPVRPIPANEFSAAFSGEPMPNEGGDDFLKRRAKLASMGALGPERLAVDAQEASRDMADAQKVQRTLANDAEQAAAVQQREANAAARQQAMDARRAQSEAAAAAKKDARTRTALLEQSGIEMEIGPEGDKVPKKHADGALVHKARYEGDPYQSTEDGKYYRDFVDDHGDIKPVDLEHNGDIHTDAQTGQRYISIAGQPRMDLGTDEQWQKRGVIAGQIAQQREAAAVMKKQLWQTTHAEDFIATKTASEEGSKELTRAKKRLDEAEQKLASASEGAQEPLRQGFIRAQEAFAAAEKKHGPVIKDFDTRAAAVRQAERDIHTEEEKTANLVGDLNAVKASRFLPKGMAKPMAMRAEEAVTEAQKTLADAQAAHNEAAGALNTAGRVPMREEAGKAFSQKATGTLTETAQAVKVAAARVVHLRGLGGKVEEAAAVASKAYEETAPKLAEITRQKQIIFGRSVDGLITADAARAKIAELDAAREKISAPLRAATDGHKAAVAKMAEELPEDFVVTPEGAVAMAKVEEMAVQHQVAGAGSVKDGAVAALEAAKKAGATSVEGQDIDQQLALLREAMAAKEGSTKLWKNVAAAVDLAMGERKAGKDAVVSFEKGVTDAAAELVKAREGGADLSGLHYANLGDNAAGKVWEDAIDGYESDTRAHGWLANRVLTTVRFVGAAGGSAAALITGKTVGDVLRQEQARNAQRMIGSLDASGTAAMLKEYGALSTHWKKHGTVLSPSEKATAEKNTQLGETEERLRFFRDGNAISLNYTLLGAEKAIRDLESGSWGEQGDVTFKEFTNSLPFVGAGKIEIDESDPRQVAQRNVLQDRLQETISKVAPNLTIAAQAGGSLLSFILAGQVGRAVGGGAAAAGAGANVARGLDLLTVGGVMGTDESLQENPGKLGFMNRAMDIGVKGGTLMLSERLGDAFGVKLQKALQARVPAVAGRFAGRAIGGGVGEFTSDLAQNAIEGRDPLEGWKQMAAVDGALGLGMAIVGMFADARVRKIGGKPTAGAFTGAMERFQTASAALDAARQNGDTAAAAVAADAVNASLSGLSETAGVTLAVSPKTQRALAGILGAETRSLQTGIEGNEHLRVAGVALGREMRDLYLPGAKWTAAQNVARSEVDFDGDAAGLADAVVDQHTGAIAARELGDIAQGTATLSPEKLSALSRLGLVTTGEDGNLSITESAVPFLPAAVRKSIAAKPGDFRVVLTPGVGVSLANDLFDQGAQIVHAASQRVTAKQAAAVAEVLKPAQNENATASQQQGAAANSNGVASGGVASGGAQTQGAAGGAASGRWKVTLEVQNKKGDKVNRKPDLIDAPTSEEAVAKATKRAEKSGLTVTNANAVEVAGAKGTTSAPVNITTAIDSVLTAGMDEQVARAAKDGRDAKALRRALDAIKNGSVLERTRAALAYLYAKLRTVKGGEYSGYVVSEADAAAAGVSTAATAVRNENKWFYRGPAGLMSATGWKGRKGNAKFSANVTMSAGLISDLDAFVGDLQAQGVDAYYKTPEEAAGWDSRHDPVSIYASESLTPAQTAALAAILTPHVRSKSASVNALTGTKIAEGVFEDANPSKQQLSDAIAKAKAVGGAEFGAAVEAYLGNKASTGQLRAVEDLINSASTPSAESATPATPAAKAPAVTPATTSPKAGATGSVGAESESNNAPAKSEAISEKGKSSQSKDGGAESQGNKGSQSSGGARANNGPAAPATGVDENGQLPLAPVHGQAGTQGNQGQGGSPSATSAVQPGGRPAAAAPERPAQKWQTGLGRNGQAGKRLSALERAGVTVVKTSGHTRAQADKDGTASIHINPAKLTEASANATVDEEISHFFAQDVLIKAWREAVAKGDFTGDFHQYRAQQTTAMIEDLQTRIGQITDVAEREAAEAAVLGAFNTYYGDASEDHAPATTVAEAMQQLRDGVNIPGTNYSGSLWGFTLELARMLDQAQRKGHVTEETHDIFRLGKIGQWVRDAIAAITAFAKNLMDAGHALHGSEMAKFAREVRETMDAWFARGGTDVEGESITDVRVGGESVATGGAWSAKNPRGKEVLKGAWALMPVRLLGLNKQFGTDQDRINRETSGAAQRAEIEGNMTEENIPLAWGSSNTLNDGSPIITPDGSVVIGNNRTMTLKAVFATNPSKAAIYQNFARAEATRQGIDGDAHPGESVVLVRVLADTAGLDRGSVVKAANKTGVEPKSEAELALEHSAVLDDSTLLALLQPNEDGSLNVEFVQAFARGLADRSPVLDSNKRLDMGKAEAAAQRAMLAALLRGAKNSERVLSTLITASGRDGMKRTLAGVFRALPGLLKIQRLNPRSGILIEVGRALAALPDYRAQLDKGTVKNVGEYLAQGDLLEPGLEGKLLGYLAEGHSAAEIADNLGSYVAKVEAQGDPNQDQMFAVAPVDKETMGGVFAKPQRTGAERRLAVLTAKGKLTASEEWEKAVLERNAGQQFIPGAEGPAFALDRETAAAQLKAAVSDGMEQMALFAKMQAELIDRSGKPYNAKMAAGPASGDQPPSSIAVPRTIGPDALAHAHAAQVAHRAKLADWLAAHPTTPLVFSPVPDRVGFISTSPSTGKWRLTHFQDQQPTGHMEYDSKVEALEDAMTYYRKLEPTALFAKPQGAMTVASDAPPKDKPVTLLLIGTFNPATLGHRAGIEKARQSIEAAGYTVARTVVVPASDATAKAKLGGKALSQADRMTMVKQTMPGVEVSNEMTTADVQRKRIEIANWARAKYPDSSIVNVVGEDKTYGFNPAPHALYGGYGAEYAGQYFLSLSRPASAISSSAIRNSVEAGDGVPAGFMQEDAAARYLQLAGFAPVDKSVEDETTSAAQATLKRLSDTARGQLRPEFLAAALSEKPDYGIAGAIPTAGLPVEQRMIEAHFFQQIADNPKKAFAEYVKLAVRETSVRDGDGKVIEAGTPRYLNTDLAREVYAPYANDKAARSVIERATVAPAGYIANALAWDYWISQGPSETKPYGLFVSGAMASGKTTAVRKLLGPEKAASSFLWDGPMAGYERGRELVAAALARGFQVKLAHVFRPYDQAAAGAIKRIGEEGRSVPYSMLPEAHYNAQLVFLRLVREFSGHANFSSQAIISEGTKEEIRFGTVDELAARLYSLGDGKGTENERGGRAEVPADGAPGGPEDGADTNRDTGAGARGTLPGPAGAELRAGTGGRTEARSGGEGAGSEAGRQLRQRLGLTGTAAQRIAAMRRIYIGLADESLARGEINNAQYRSLFYGNGAFVPKQSSEQEQPLAKVQAKVKEQPSLFDFIPAKAAATAYVASLPAPAPAAVKKAATQDGMTAHVAGELFNFAGTLTPSKKTRKVSNYEHTHPSLTHQRPTRESTPSVALDDLFSIMAGRREAELHSPVAGGAEGDAAAGSGLVDVGGDGLLGENSAGSVQTTRPGERGGSLATDGSAELGRRGDGGREGSGGSESVDGRGNGATGSVDPGLAPLVERPSEPDARNHIIAPGAPIAPRGLVTKLKANLVAVKLLKKIQGEHRMATAEEKAALVQFTGWGALSQAFDQDKADYIAKGERDAAKEDVARYKNSGADYYKELAKTLEEQIRQSENWEKKWGVYHAQLTQALTPEEWRRARASTINAHYTSEAVITPMWQIATRLGFRGGNVGEMAAGIGHFFGLMPQELQDRSKLFGVEMDPISAGIAQLLYPEADIQNSPFQTADVADNSLDLNIGNVPFANIPITDPFIASQDGPVDSLHDYYFAKMLQKTRPGGLIVAITSAFTMDKLTATNRKWLAERADLVSAFRLPNSAFKENAGTDVVTDILVFRKRDGAHFEHGQEWTGLADSRTAKGDAIRVNEYFAAHPGNVLGLLADDGEMFAGRGDDAKEMTVHPDPARPVDVALAQAIDSLPANIVGSGSGARVRGTAVAVGVKMGSIAKDAGGHYSFHTGGKPSASDAELNLAKNRPRVAAFVAVRDALNRQYELELSPTATAEEIEANREELNRLYDTFKSRHKDMHDRANKSLFMDDPDYFRLAGAEIEQKNKGGIKGLIAAVRGKAKVYEKADVFRKRVLSPREEPTHADSIEDAMGMSLGWRGRVDTAYIGQLTGLTRDQVETALLEREIVLRDPSTGQIQSREQYLAGNVRKKLEIARASGPEFERNVRLLEAAQPADVSIGDIKFNIGATWIPADIYKKFMASLGMGVNITYSTAGSGADSWHVSTPTRLGSQAVKYKDFESGRFSADTMLDALLNMRRIEIRNPAAEGGKVNPEATAMAQNKANALKEEFERWTRDAPGVGERLAAIYNKEVNGFALRTYDGQHLTFPWASMDFSIFPDKKNTVWRAIQEGFGLIAHGVGGGKTIVGSAIALELRRLGLARKPMIVVHNATLGQFADAIVQMAPAARVLVGSKDELQGAKRKEFLMRIAAGDWDAVVIAHSTFNLIADDPAFMRKQMENLMDELRASLTGAGYNSVSAAKDDRKKSATVKQTVKLLEALEAKITEASARTTDTELLPFQSLGVDALIVDEVHKFKKMPFATKLDVKGIDGGMSKAGYGLLMRARGIQEKNGGKNVFTMTGTPVTNTLGEVWNQVRLVAPHLLKEYGIEKFDQFVSKFATVESKSEADPTGARKMVERLAKIINLPEWATFFRMAADVKFGDDMVTAGRPAIKGGKAELVAVERTVGATAWVNYIREVLTAFKTISYKEKMENPALMGVPVTAYMASRAAAIDIRLVEPRAKDEPGSKVNLMVERAMGIYKATGEYKGTQVIFADAMNPTKVSLFDMVSPLSGLNIPLDPTKEPGTTFHLYDDIRKKLIARGVPESQIAALSDKKYQGDSGEKAKAALWEKVNSGEVRFVIGSTEKLGTGVNMQRLMAAAHHLDVPWTPAGLEQRDGRVERQGNLHMDMGLPIEIIRYGMKDTLDEALWGILERKQRFIASALSGKLSGREIEEDEMTLSLGEQMAILSGPYGQEMFETDNRLRELQYSKQAHEMSERRRAAEIAEAVKETAKVEREIASGAPQFVKMERLAAAVAKDGAQITVDGEVFETKKAMLDAVNKLIEDARTDYEGKAETFRETPVPVLSSLVVNGVPVRLTGVQETQTIYGEETQAPIWERITLRFRLEGNTKEGYGDVTSANTLLSRLDELGQKVAARRDTLQRNLDRARALAAMAPLGPWAYQAEYDRKSARAVELVGLMRGEKKDSTGIIAPVDLPLLAKPQAAVTPMQLVKDNLGLAVDIARRYSNVKAPLADIVSAAKIGLVRAARAYDASKGPFAPYASRAIRNELNGMFATEGERAAAEVSSLDEPLGEDGTTAGEQVAGTGAADVLDPITRRETSAALDAAIAKLPEYPRAMLTGLRAGMSMDAIGAERGVTKQAISKVAEAARRAVASILKRVGHPGLDADGALLAKPVMVPLGTDEFQIDQEVDGILDAQNRTEAERAERDAQGVSQGFAPDSVGGWWKETYNRHLRGSLDALDFFAKGTKEVMVDAHQDKALVQAGVREQMEARLAEIKETFGNAKDDEGKLLRQRFVAEMLPVAARLNPVGFDANDAIVFEHFEMRAGSLPHHIAAQSGVRTGSLYEQRGEWLKVGEYLQEQEAYQLLRVMPVERQQKIHADFHERYPGLAYMLDEWIEPGQGDARVTDARGTVMPTFNRHSLREFFGEISPHGELSEVTGYVPEVARTKSLAGALAGAVRNLLNGNFKSGAREYKTGAAREGRVRFDAQGRERYEAGDVKDLFAGFSIRAMEAHAEAQRLALAEKLLALPTVLQSIPPDGVPDGWVAVNPNAMSQMAKLYGPAQGMDAAQLKAFSDAVAKRDMAALQKLVGKAWSLMGSEKMIRKEVFGELVRPLVDREIRNKFVKIVDKLARIYTGSLLTHPFSWIQNQASNEFFKMMRAMQRAAYGALMVVGAGAEGRKQAKVAFAEAWQLTKLLGLGRFTNRADYRELVPKELFEGDTSISGAAMSITEERMTAKEHLSQWNVPSAILTAVGYSAMDIRTKQQLAYASFIAHASVAADDAEAKGYVFANKKQRVAWMKNWLKTAGPELQREAIATAEAYAMDYKNVPWWLDNERSAQWWNVIRPWILPFAKWPYNLARQMKRLGGESAFNTALYVAGKSQIPYVKKMAEERGVSHYGPKVANSVAHLVAFGMLYAVARAMMGRAKDEDEADALGRSFDEAGKRLDSQFNTSSRVRMGDPFDRPVRALAKMFGNEKGTDDYWLRIRTLPYASPLMAVAATSGWMTASKEAKAGEKSEAMDAWASFLEDFNSEGVLLSVMNKLTGKESKYNAGQTIPTTLGATAVDVTLARVAPAPLLSAVRDMVDPVMRRTNPNKSLGYEPGVVEGMKSRLPVLSKDLPPKGRVKTQLLENAVEDIAALDAKGKANAYRIAASKTGKPTASYVNPEELVDVPRWKTALRFAGMNVKPVDRAGYKRAVAGDETEYRRALRSMQKGK